MQSKNTTILTPQLLAQIHARASQPTPLDIDIQNVQVNSRRALPDRDAQGWPKCFYCNTHGHISRAAGKHLSRKVVEEHYPQMQAATSSRCMVCSLPVQIKNTSHEALLDSGSTISSISQELVHQLGLHISTTPPIIVLFGDNNQKYHSHSQVHCTFSLAHKTFTHAFYVLPRQLFPFTLGCDWFIKTKARLYFDSQHLILPNTILISMFCSHQGPNFVHAQYVVVDQCTRLHDIRTMLCQFPKLFKTQTHASQINLPITHHINTGNAPPIRMPSCRRYPLEKERISMAVQDMLRKGVIKPSCSDWVSKPHLVWKEDDSYKFCIDFWPLNKVTIHDLYPLPRIDDLLDQLGKSQYFTSLDLASGYWQIPLHASDAHKTTFQTPMGLYEFTRMPFGQSDVGSSFQQTTNNIFGDLIDQGVVLVYLDDILIHTELGLTFRGSSQSLEENSRLQSPVAVQKV
ncbi:hypothetical protein L7F22_020299 [Adiantum nelumboides]|nr:hypothetical protein [Adiantum nelumboides]